MSLYARAKRHVYLMLVNTLVGVVFILLSDQFFGHSTIAFAIVIGILFFLNLGIWKFNCPRCGSNLFIWDKWPLPWPNRLCSNCKLDLAGVRDDSRER